VRKVKEVNRRRRRDVAAFFDFSLHNRSAGSPEVLRMIHILATAAKHLSTELRSSEIHCTRDKLETRQSEIARRDAGKNEKATDRSAT